jgi:hypothetical protein
MAPRCVKQTTNSSGALTVNCPKRTQTQKAVACSLTCGGSHAPSRLRCPPCGEPANKEPRSYDLARNTGLTVFVCLAVAARVRALASAFSFYRDITNRIFCGAVDHSTALVLCSSNICCSIEIHKSQYFDFVT